MARASGELRSAVVVLAMLWLPLQSAAACPRCQMSFSAAMRVGQRAGATQANTLPQPAGHGCPHGGCCAIGHLHKVTAAAAAVPDGVAPLATVAVVDTGVTVVSAASVVRPQRLLDSSHSPPRYLRYATLLI